MAMDQLVAALEERISELPLFDAHTHLVGGHLGARGLHDIMLYHMGISDLHAAGCPSGARLTQYPGWPTIEESHQRIREALPYLKRVRNTTISWGRSIILRDLYGFDEELDDGNWQKIDSAIRERADDAGWHREIMNRARIRRFVTEYARREEGRADDILQYSLEWGFFTRCQWGEYDTALYELERCWGKLPESPMPIGGGSRPETERTIRTLDDVHAAIAWYVGHMPADKIVGMATSLSTDIDYRVIDDREMRESLSRRSTAGPEERDTYASYINEAFLTALEKQHGDRIAYQFGFGAEPLPYETGSRLNQRTIAQLAEIVGRHPGLNFHCYAASRHANQSLCTLCRELPNLCLVGYWWHNFFQSPMRQIMEERLDMLPTSKQIGFFSDAYCIEWSYAKSIIVKRELARVLAAKVELGQYDIDSAVDIARETFYDTTRDLMRMVPAEAATAAC